MKFGIFSDIHNEFDKGTWDFEPGPDVYYLNAGDTDSNRIRRTAFFGRHSNHMFGVLGNHDYYFEQFSNDPTYGITPYYENRGGFKIAGATLWTNLTNYTQWGDYIHGLVDHDYIDRLTYDLYNDAHAVQRDYLFNSEADIIVSHHAPSYMSMHPRYKGSIYNPGFMTEFSDRILDMKNPPKLWVHGHVHDAFDYMIGSTRVVCNPRGYKGESNYENYKPKIVEL